MNIDTRSTSDFTPPPFSNDSFGVELPPLPSNTSYGNDNVIVDSVFQSVSLATAQLVNEYNMPSFVASDVLDQLHAFPMCPVDIACVPYPVHHCCCEADLHPLVHELSCSIVNWSNLIFTCGDCDDGGHGKGNWLVAIARAMGKAAGEHAKRLVELSNEIEAASGQDGGAAANVTGLQAEFQAESQMFSMVQNAFSNAVKSIGEGMSTMARKG